VGCWIARAELLWQHGAEEPGAWSATRLVRARARSLIWMLPLVMIMCQLIRVPGWLTALINMVLPWGIGAFLVSLLLLVLVLCSLVLVILHLGVLSFGIMPATLAAEGSDNFDAISRGYSYFFQQPLLFFWWWG